VKREKSKMKAAAKSRRRTTKKAGKKVTRKIAKKAAKKPARKATRTTSSQGGAKATRRLARKPSRKAAAKAKAKAKTKAKTKTKTKTVRSAVRTKSIAPKRPPSKGLTRLTPKTGAQSRRSAQRWQGRDLSSLNNAALTSISNLDLSGHAKSGAEALLAAHPDVVFTSGRRSVQQQAHAMAGNVLGNRNWIRDTYAESPERYELQTWVDTHPEALTRDQITAGLRTVMNGWNDTRKVRLSRHFAGLAFDVRPVAGAGGDSIKTTIRALPYLRRFLDSEGGMVIWHAEFAPI
jgi:hypothetical protein